MCSPVSARCSLRLPWPDCARCARLSSPAAGWRISLGASRKTIHGNSTQGTWCGRFHRPRDLMRGPAGLDRFRWPVPDEVEPEPEPKPERTTNDLPISDRGRQPLRHRSAHGRRQRIRADAGSCGLHAAFNFRSNYSRADRTYSTNSRAALSALGSSTNEGRPFVSNPTIPKSSMPQIASRFRWKSCCPLWQVD